LANFGAAYAVGILILPIKTKPQTNKIKTKRNLIKDGFECCGTW
jgi:hypothetical protein